MKPDQVRKVMASLIAQGELPEIDPDRLIVELYMHNGLTQKAIAELTGWNIASVNERISRWLQYLRNKLVSYNTMKAHSGYNLYSDYYVYPSYFSRRGPRLPLSTEQAQRATAIRLARDAVRRPRRRVLPKRAVSERLRYASELLAVWPG